MDRTSECAAISQKLPSQCRQTDTQTDRLEWGVVVVGGSAPACSTQGYVLPEVENWWLSPQRGNVPEFKRKNNHRLYLRAFLRVVWCECLKWWKLTTCPDDKARRHISSPNNCFVSLFWAGGQRSADCDTDRKKVDWLTCDWPPDMATPHWHCGSHGYWAADKHDVSIRLGGGEVQERSNNNSSKIPLNTHTHLHTTNLPLKSLFSQASPMRGCSPRPILQNQRAQAASANNIKASGAPLSKSMPVSIVSKLSAQRRVKEEER